MTVIKLTLASLAIPLASIVLPQPGGPYNSTPPPLISNPSFLNLSFDLMGRMISLIRAYLICSNAPISFKLVVGILANPYLFKTGETNCEAVKKSFNISDFDDSILDMIRLIHCVIAY